MDTTNAKQMANVTVTDPNDVEYGRRDVVADFNLGVEVAGIITDQLGGRRIYAMAFQKSHIVTACEEHSGGIIYMIAPSVRKMTSNKAVAVRITLSWADEYRVEFFRDVHCLRSIEVIEPVYCDNLREIIERKTGLLLSL